MTPERVRVAHDQGPKPGAVVPGLRPAFEKRRQLAQPLLHFSVLAREGVHGSAVGRQFRCRDQRTEEHTLLAIVMEVAGELGEERGEAPAVGGIRSPVDESADVRSKRAEHPIDQHVFVLECVEQLHRRFIEVCARSTGSLSSPCGPVDAGPVPLALFATPSPRPAVFGACRA
jgi:hypothetical protein